jgi:hypothetical protein
MWIRTCQECGHNQTQKKAPIYGEPASDAYLFRKCEVCRSSGLDYGSEHDNNCTVRDGKWNDKCSCVSDEDKE